MTFDEMGLIKPLLTAVQNAGYASPTPIQAATFEALLDGKDLMASAQTGTGKTAAFALPILQRLNEDGAKRGAPRCLVLTPTRELAAQVHDSFVKYGSGLKLESTVVFGGVKIGPQIKTLRRGTDIVVATPGRLLDLHNQRAIDLRKIEVVVLDEADRMLDMGFIRDIQKILAVLPSNRQSLMFSATFSGPIRKLGQSLLTDPVEVETARKNKTADLIEQHLLEVDKPRKAALLAHLLHEHGWHQCLVFTRTKHGANALVRKLDKAGIRAAAIHGNKSQAARTRSLTAFKEGKLPVLVATDIASRGLDISELPVVINYELPDVPEDYVHRIGRTARAGESGVAYSLVCLDESKKLADIERFMDADLNRDVLAGFEPEKRLPPRQKRQQGQRSGNGRSRQSAGSGSGGRCRPSRNRRNGSGNRSEATASRRDAA